MPTMILMLHSGDPASKPQDKRTRTGFLKIRMRVLIVREYGAY